MPDEAEKLAELIKKFRELKTHDEKCEFFNRSENYPLLGRIYNPIHFQKPAAQSETE